MFCVCTGLAPGSDHLAPKARLGARAHAAKSARRGAGAKPGDRAFTLKILFTQF